MFHTPITTFTGFLLLSAKGSHLAQRAMLVEEQRRKLDEWLGKLRLCNLGKIVVVLGDLLPSTELEAPLHLCNKNNTVSLHQNLPHRKGLWEGGREDYGKEGEKRTMGRRDTGSKIWNSLYHHDQRIWKEIWESGIQMYPLAHFRNNLRKGTTCWGLVPIRLKKSVNWI